MCRKNPLPNVCYATKVRCTLPSGHCGPHDYHWIDPRREAQDAQEAERLALDVAKVKNYAAKD